MKLLGERHVLFRTEDGTVGCVHQNPGKSDRGISSAALGGRTTLPVASA